MSAIDFGCSSIRCLHRDFPDRNRLRLFSERSEYIVIPAGEAQERVLGAEGIPFAECQDALAVVGNEVDRARWLSRMPPASLFDEGRVPQNDPPARQMLNLLLEAMLPVPTEEPAFCGVVVPAADGSMDLLVRNELFLFQLIRMRGYEPVPVDPALAAALSSGVRDAFTGISVVVGAQSCAIGATRLGRLLASARIPMGTDWIDEELAREYRIHSYDAAGSCYLDLDAVRAWRVNESVHLHQPAEQRGTTLARLFAAVLDRIIGRIAELIGQVDASRESGSRRVSITIAGGAALQPGFAALMTERLVENQLADQVSALRIADAPDTAVVRGGLILAELEARGLTMDRFAA